MNSEDKLKPCPFCGSENIEEGESLFKHEGKYYSQAGCLDCGAMGPDKQCGDPGSVVGPERYVASTKAWNLRK